MLASLGLSWLMIAIFGFFTNMLVLIAVVKSTLLKHHPATNIFIMSLCLSHLLTCVSIAWDIYTMICRYETWLQCRYDGLGTLSAIGTSMFNTGAIAVSRLLLVTRPDTYNWLFTHFKMAVIITALWVLPPLAAFIVPETHQTLFVTHNGTCASQTLTPQYYRALAALYYPIPTVVIVFSYGLIYWHIRSHFRRQQSHVSPPRGRNCTSPVSSLPPDSAFAGTNIQRRRCKAQNEIVSNIFFPILATITFSLPLCVTLAIGETNYIKFTITIYLCNLGVAPVVYGLRNQQLKVSIGRLLNWQCPQKPQGYYSTTVNMSNFSRNRYVEATIQ